jgi:hypothetical protein
MYIDIHILGACLIVFAAGFAGYVYGRITTQKRCEKSFFSRGVKRNG